MKHKKSERGVLLKSGISRESLINDFISGMSLREIGKNHNRTSERIWQVIRKGCDKQGYAEYGRQNKKNRKAKELNKFLAYADELGRVPLLNEAKALKCGLQTHYREFRKIAESNGFEYATGTNKRGRRRTYSTEQMLGYLKDLALRLGHTPSCNEINRERKYSHNMYVTGFGSLKKAQELAGLAPNKKYNSLENARRHSKYITKEQCLEDLKRLHIELGGAPSLAQLKKHGKYPFSKYYSRLGGIKKIRTLAELKQHIVPIANTALKWENFKN